MNAFLVCGLANALDGSEDDLVSDDVPAVDAESVKIEEEAHDESDVDDMGDPFSDSDSDDNQEDSP